MNIHGDSNKGPLIRFEHLTDNSFSFSDEERHIFRQVTILNVFELKEFFIKSPPINITKLIDSSGYTPLHLAVYKNSFNMT